MTTAARTEILTYDRTLGLSVMEGRGFYYPADTVIGDNGKLYVVNRSLESVDRGVRVTVCDLQSEYYGTFGAYGEGDGQFIWLTSGAKNSEGHIYLTDEYLHRVTAFDADGNFLRVWGAHGRGEGELDGPCGIAIDADDNILVSDTYNNRVQKFSPTGVPLATFGVDTLSMPWGITVAPSGELYAADWGNDRIARFTSEGDFIASYGEPGRAEGKLVKPASVAVDTDGNIYVADWGNERVQAFDADGNFLQLLRGEATLSPWAVNFLSINREEGEARSRADLERDIDFFDPNDPHEVSSHIEKFFWSPMSVKLDGKGRLFVTESNRHRIQVYRLT
jgi:DNA-binding beta-propeller fold protein YncE